MTTDQLEVLKRHTSDVPVRVGKLANDLGLEVHLSTLSPNISGLIEPSSTAPAGFAIKVNRYDMPERQRFTIAHEIAHYLLHKDYILSGVVDSIMYRSSLSSRKEAEANRLAAQIVMPPQRVSEEHRKLENRRDDDAVRNIASVFKVSVTAMKIGLGVS